MTDREPELSPLKRALIEIRQLRAAAEEADLRRREPIAVVGVGLRFPGGAVDRRSYWRILRDGVDTITTVPADRWDAEGFYDPDPDAPGKMVTKEGGFLHGVDRFDASFFGISHREAASIDPQQRLLLATAWEALEDANIPPESLFGDSAGVFVGIINGDYLRMLMADVASIDSYAGSGNALSVAAGRIAYVLGTEGPAISYDTACSSSLVSVHAAAQSLRQRECNLAIAGGVNLILSPELTINHSQARMMAPDGRCKTFDAAADGYVRSEGCGLVVLKRLSDAEASGDRILAVIRGSAVNQDGRSGGLTAPNGPSQERVIAAALEASGLDADAVSYVETHGTGTPLGDPIEIGALRNVLSHGRTGDQTLRIGSVKTNIGHTEAAAGIAGLIKTVLMLQHDEIPPHLHLRELNPHLGSLIEGISIPTENTPWPRTDQPRIAGVSSFGLSGTNAHVIVSDPPATPAAPDGSGSANDGPRILPLSARSDEALATAARHHAALLEVDGGLEFGSLVTAAALNRSHLDRRLAVVGSTADQVGAALRAFADGGETSVVVGPAPVGTPINQVAFLFTGHGSQYPAMGAGLYRSQPVFAQAIDDCADVLGSRTGLDLKDILFGDGAALSTMRASQPALFSLQYALTRLWGAWGVRPTIVAGHSVGEYAAAVSAGALDLADGMALVAERGRLLDTLAPGGAMVALFVAESQVAEVVGDRNDVGVAAVNGPRTTVISGKRDAVDEVIEYLALDEDELRRLDIPVAAHSPLVEPILDEFAAAAASVNTVAPNIGLVSSMTGRLADQDLLTADYWRRHLRAPVRFGSVFDTLHQSGCGVMVEIGPAGTLVAQGRRAWPEGPAVWTASLDAEQDDAHQMLTALASVHTAGVDLDWPAITATPSSSRPAVDLPLYPWQERSYWAVTGSHGQPRSKVTRWQSANHGAERRAASAPLGLRIDAYPDRWELVDRLCIGAMVNAVIDLGCFTSDGEELTAETVVATGQVIVDQAPLVTRWLDHLVDAGLLHRTDDTYRSGSALTRTDITQMLADNQVDLSGIEPLIEYLLNCSRSLVEIVTGAESPLATLFPDGAYDVVDFLYHHWDIPTYYSGIVGGAIAAVAATRSGRPIRVLEVGAGTGGTTAHVLAELADANVRYHFTDVSDFFLTRARDRFAGHDGLSFGIVDLEHPPEAQGVEAGGFDVVVAANVLHATGDLDKTLDHVRRLLAPGGVLMAYEGTAYPRWADISTALIEGWQRFDDEWREDVPLVSADTWHLALAAAGFTEVATYPGDIAARLGDNSSYPGNQTIADVLLHHVILARAPGEDAFGYEPPTGSLLDNQADVSAAILAPQADDVAARLADAMEDERHDVLVDVVRDCIASVLRTPDPSSLQRDLPLQDLGFDSLMAVEFRDVLRAALGLDRKLPATLVYDQPTIRSIAGYLDGLLRGTDPEPMEVTEVPPESAFADIDEDDVEAALLAKLEEVER